MENCSNTCQLAMPTVEAPEVTEAAEALACLLADTSEFQNFLRLSRAVRLDGEVNDLLNQINGYAPLSDSRVSSLDLQNRLESLPLVREYRQAERAAREVFQAVDQTISAAAGINFAETAQHCGGG